MVARVSIEVSFSGVAESSGFQLRELKPILGALAGNAKAEAAAVGTTLRFRVAQDSGGLDPVRELTELDGYVSQSVFEPPHLQRRQVGERACPHFHGYPRRAQRSHRTQEGNPAAWRIWGANRGGRKVHARAISRSDQYGS